MSLSSPTQPLDLDAIEKTIAHYDGKNRVNGIYANDDLKALIARVLAAEAAVGRVQTLVAAQIDEKGGRTLLDPKDILATLEEP